MTLSDSPGRFLANAALTLFFGFSASAAFADCLKDRYGDVYCGGGRCVIDRDGVVWCARNYEGGAILRRDGAVMCGIGQCTKDRSGEVFCSSETGGAVVRDSSGHVRCHGTCEPATVEACEHTRAGSSER